MRRFGWSTLKGRFALTAAAAVTALLGLAVLMPGSALAWPAGLVSIKGQPNENHPISTWCKLPRLESELIETATSPEVGEGGHFLQKNLLTFNVVGKNDTSFTDEYEFKPGTYYVHVGTYDPKAKRPEVPLVEFSNVLRFVVLAGPRIVGSVAPCPPPPKEDGGGGVTDKVAPVISLRFPRVQDIDKVYVKVRASETATIRATGTIRVGKAARVYRFKTTKLTLPGNASKKVRLRLAKKKLRAVKRVLRKRKRVKAKITVTATDAAGNRRTKKATLRLKN